MIHLISLVIGIILGIFMTLIYIRLTNKKMTKPKPIYNHEFNNIGIVGFGQIGTAIHTIYKNTFGERKYLQCKIYDPFKNMNDNLSECELINICIPFTNYESFKKNIIDLKLKNNCIVIIHSTIEMSTCNKLQIEPELKNYIFISSPVRGVHPDLVDGMYTFQKYIGISNQYYNDIKIVNKVQNHMESLNISTFICKSNESELAKLLSTTLYGLNISVVEDIGQLCDYYNLNFDNVFTNWQYGYNIGYKKLNKSNVLRPILTRIPNKEKIIGGHCILPNCIILKKMEPKYVTKHVTNFILRYSDKHSRKHHTQMLLSAHINRNK
eukprot:344439_1